MFEIEIRIYFEMALFKILTDNFYSPLAVKTHNKLESND
jgi:hypothetical protein